MINLIKNFYNRKRIKEESITRLAKDINRYTADLKDMRRIIAYEDKNGYAHLRSPFVYLNIRNCANNLEIAKRKLELLNK